MNPYLMLLHEFHTFSPLFDIDALEGHGSIDIFLMELWLWALPGTEAP